MKLTVIGGAGVRTPLLMSALARRQEAIDLREVFLMDVDEAKLGLMAPLCRYVAERSGAGFALRWGSEPAEALSGAGAVITTIRAGTEEARVKDERIALQHGVLGQETTGPGGFAMALRTIPAVSSYAGQMQQYCPDAWLLNFTNPAGLVAQALTEAFPGMRIVGICDTPTGMRQEVAAVFGRKPADLSIRFFGLNHLSWMPEAMVDGENVVPRIIQDPALAARIHTIAMFEPELLRLVGMLPNEYLYYYYYRERAVANIQAAGETRGEQVRRLSGDLMRDLQAIDPAVHPDQAWRRYRRYLGSRHGSYMAAETGAAPDEREEESAELPSGEEGEGYAGVALDILSASKGQATTMVVNVPNRGAVKGMKDDDVVETVCLCDQTGLHPQPQGEIPEPELLLMQQVKLYERLTVEAIRRQSRDLAVEALMAHPLVNSYSLAHGLVDAYLDAHRDYVGEWHG